MLGVQVQVSLTSQADCISATVPRTTPLPLSRQMPALQ